MANKFCDALLTTGANDGSTFDDAYQSEETALEQPAIGAGNKLYIRRRSGFCNPTSHIQPTADGAPSIPIQIIGCPRRATFGEGVFEQGSNVIRGVIRKSNLIDRGECESEIPPMIFQETTPLISAVAFTRDSAQKRNGDFSYKVRRTAGPGGSHTVVRLMDSAETDDMHGLEAEKTYTFEVWVKVLSNSGISLDEIDIRLMDYAGGWETIESSSPTTYDIWEKLTVVKTIRAAATATNINILLWNTADLDENFYVDDIRLIEHDASTELIPKLEQYGTRMIKNDTDGRKYMISALAHKIDYDNLSGLFTEGLMVTGAGGCEGKIHRLEEVLGTNYIDRGDCESETPPMVTPETVPYTWNTTFTRDSAQKRNGTYSYKGTKTSASGIGSIIDLTDNDLGTDLHGLVPGETYVWEMWIKILSSSGIALNEVTMLLRDYQGGWGNSYSNTATAFDTWQKLTVIRTFRAGATGIDLRININSNAELNEYFYADDIRLRKLSEETGSLWIVSKARELIDRGNCEDPITPMIFHELAPYLSNMTLARSADFSRSGDYGYKLTKTVAAGTGCWGGIIDAFATDDMHGLVVNKTYTFEAWVYVPIASGIALNEVRLQLADYIASWENVFSDNPSQFDTWEKLTVTKTIRAGSTGIAILMRGEPTAALNEYYYVDDISLKNVFLDNEEITDEDTGVADVNGTPADDGFVILDNYAGVTDTGALTIEKDEDYDDFQTIDDSTWTIKKTDWNGDAEDLPIIDFGDKAYNLYMTGCYYWAIKNMRVMGGTYSRGTMYIVSLYKSLIKNCIFEQTNVAVTIYGYHGNNVFKRCLVIGNDVSQYGYIASVDASSVVFSECAIYGHIYGFRSFNARIYDCNCGIELPNNNYEIFSQYGNYICVNVNLGGKNGEIEKYGPTIIYSENKNKQPKLHEHSYDNGEIISKDVIAGSGDPYKRPNGADSVIEIICNRAAGYAPALDEWKYLVFDHEFEMDTTSRDYRYYVQCKAMTTTSAELFIEVEYVDQYVDASTYHTIKIKSDEAVAQRSSESDWSQYIEVTGIQPAVASKVRIKCYLGAYDADGRIFIDPKVATNVMSMNDPIWSYGKNDLRYETPLYDWVSFDGIGSYTT